MKFRHPSTNFLYTATRLLLLCAILASLFIGTPTRPVQAAALSATNGIYTIELDDANGNYSFSTGAAFPGYPNTQILYYFPWGGSGLAVKSYGSNRVFNTPGVGGDVPLGVPTSVQTLSGSEVGFEITWEIDNGSDHFTLVQKLVVRGTSVDDSRIVVETTVTNDDSQTVPVGIRSMWDLTLGGNDATPFQRFDPDDPAPSGTFFSAAPPAFSYGAISDSSTIDLYVGVNGPAGFVPTPTAPDAFYFADYYESYPESWTYAVSGGDSDSVLEYFWGDTPGNALVLDVGASVSVVQVMTADTTALLSCVSTGTGPWSLAASWSDCGGGIPDITKSATIRSGDAITLDQNAAVINLAVNGMLIFPDGNALTVESSLENNGTMQQTIEAVDVGGASFLNVKNATATTDKYFGVEITPNSSLGSTTVTVRGNQPACTNNPNDPIINRCFDISPETPAPSTVRYYFANGELNGQSWNSMNVWHWSPYWNTAGTGAVYSASCSIGQIDCWVQVDEVASFSPFVLGSSSSPTNVTITSLSAVVDQSNIVVHYLLLALVGTALWFLFRLRTKTAAFVLGR
jgi:hypothetical protein